MSTENYLRELRWKEINALRAEVEDWKDNYNKATDACVALRAENVRLRERLRFDDEEPYAHIKRLEDENARWTLKEGNARAESAFLRAEVRDWQENYKQAMDGRVALRAENTKLRETLGALVEFADRFLPGNPTVEKARAALAQKEPYSWNAGDRIRDARNEALEEAAKLCEDHGHSNGSIRGSHKHLAAAIRALKG